MPWPRRRTVFIVVAGILVAASLAVVLFVTSGGLHGWLRSMALSQIAQALDADVSIGRLSGSLLHGVTVHDLRIVKHGRVVVEAETVEVGYQIVQIARGDLRFGDLRLVRPRVWLEQTGTGWNINQLIRERMPAASPRVWKVQFDRLNIEDGIVDLLLKGRDPLRFEGLDLAGGLGLGSAASSIRIDTATFHETTGGMAARISGEIDIDSARMAFNGLRVIVPGADLSGQFVLAQGTIDGVKVNARFADWQPGTVTPYAPAVPVSLPSLTGDLVVTGSARTIDARWTLATPASGTSNGLVRLSPNLPGALGIVGDVAVQELNPAGYVDRPALKGRINADLRLDLSVALDDLVRTTGTVGVRARNSRMAQYVVDRLDGRARLSGSAVRLNGTAAAYRATATMAATVTLARNGGVRSLTSQGRLGHVDLRAMPRNLNLPQLASDVSADYSAAWSGDRWSVHLDARDSTLNGIRIADTTSVDVAGRGSAVTTSGTARLSAIPSSLLRLPKDVASELDGSITWQATIPEISRVTDLSLLEGSVEFTATETDPQSLNPTHTTGAVVLENGIAQVNRFEVRSPLANISAAGRIAVANPSLDSDLLYTVDAPDLTRLDGFGLPAMKGSVRTSGRITGPSGAWRVTGSLAGQELAYSDRFEALTLNGELDVAINSADWLGTSGTVSLKSSFLKVAGTELLNATVVATHHERRLDLKGAIEQVERAIEFDTGIDFYPDYQEVHLRDMTISGPGEPWRFEGPEEAVIRYGAAEVSVDHLALVRGGERINVNGRLPFGEQSAGVPLIVELTNVSMGDLTQLALGVPRVTGTTNGVISLFDLKESGTATADISLVAGQIAAVPYSDIAIKASLAGRMAEVSGRVTEPRGVALAFAGKVPVTADAGSADLRVTGSGISLGLIEALTTMVNQVQGTASIDLHATGPLNALDLDGSVRIDGGAFTVAPTGVSYRDVVADVRLDNEWAVVNRASLTDSSGGVVLITGRTGVRAVEGARAVELVISTEGIRVLNNELGDVTTRADLRIGGRLSAPSIEGRVVATSARLEVDQILLKLSGPRPLPPAVPDTTAEVAAEAAAPPSTGAETKAGAEPPPSEPPASSGWPGARIDVAVELPDNVVVRGRNLRTGAGSLGLGDVNLTLGGQVQIRKESDSVPVVAGAVEVVRGFYDFQGRRFDVARGSNIEFRGGEPSNPALDVRGERNVSGVIAQVHITGTARQPVLALSSQPSLSESDVLALIVFNQPLNQLGSNEQVDLLQRAGDLALGAVASRLTDSIGRSLDVDLFEIRAPTSDRPGEVVVGTQVSQRVFVGFRQQFGTSDVSRLSIEYQLTRALRLLTSVAQGDTRATDGRVTDTAGVDLIYTIKY